MSKRVQPRTIQNPDDFVRFLNGPDFKCPVPAKIDHSKSGLVRISDPQCSLQTNEHLNFLQTLNFQNMGLFVGYLLL